MAPAWVSCDRAGDRRRKYDAPLAPGLQPRQTRVDGEKGPFEIDIQNLIPIGDTHIGEFRGGENPRVTTE